MTELERIERLERRMRAMFLMFIVVAPAVIAANVEAQPSAPDVLRIRQLTIVDEKGTDRLIFGAPLPDQVVNGRRVRRSGAVSGIAGWTQKVTSVPNSRPETDPGKCSSASTAWASWRENPRCWFAKRAKRYLSNLRRAESVAAIQTGRAV
jgi:hypothetical protein